MEWAILWVEGLGAIPEETAEMARAALPKGSVAMWLRDEPGGLYSDGSFVDRYAARASRGSRRGGWRW